MRIMVEQAPRTRLHVWAPAFVLSVGSVLLNSPRSAWADVFHLREGESVECEILEDLGDAYRLRTLIGIIDVEKDRITRIEKKASPWKRYARKRKRTPTTAAAHYDLAQWCEREGLRAERLDELEQVLVMDPDHSAARAALGYIRDDAGRWVKKPSDRVPSPENRKARRLAKEQERLVRGIITDWFLKVRAIHRGKMSGDRRQRRPERFREARAQLLAIRDPLAVPALTGVLSTGNVPARRVLVEALSRFESDEATMNLLVVALLDPAASVRQAAAVELSRRDDDRVVARLRDALKSREEGILRNAATALGILKERSAVEDLVGALSVRERRSVLVSRPVFLGGVRAAFGGFQRFPHGRFLLRYRPTSIGVLGSSTLVGTAFYREQQVVSVHRTEVQEALIAITGRNFGFDRSAWLRWWQQQPR